MNPGRRDSAAMRYTDINCRTKRADTLPVIIDFGISGDQPLALADKIAPIDLEVMRRESIHSFGRIVTVKMFISAAARIMQIAISHRFRDGHRFDAGRIHD